MEEPVAAAPGPLDGLPLEPQPAIAPTDGKELLAVAGSTGLKRHGGWLDEEWHPQLAGKRAAKVYREMTDNDAVVGGVFFAVKMLVRQVDWRLEHTGETPDHHAAKEHAETCIHDMESTWQEFLSECLTMLPFGYSLFEETYKIRRGNDPLPEFASKFNDGRIGWRDLAIRAQETIERWEFTPQGRVLGCIQQAPPEFRVVPLAMDRLLLFRVERAKGNPEGRSLLRNAYRSWYFLKRIQEVEAIGIERDLAGLPTMQVPPHIMHPNASVADKAVRAVYETMVRKMRRDHLEGVVIPAEEFDGAKTGYKLGLLTTGGRRPVDVNEIIKRYESRIALSILAEFILLGMDKVGSFALADSKTDLFAVALGSMLKAIAEVFNRTAFPRLMVLNGWAPECAPKLCPGDIERRNVVEFANALAAMVSSGAITIDDEIENEVREEFGFSPKKLLEPMPDAPPPMVDPLAPPVTDHGAFTPDGTPPELDNGLSFDDQTALASHYAMAA